MDWQSLWLTHRIQIILALMGFVLSGLGIFLLFSNQTPGGSEVQIIDENIDKESSQIIVQVTGAVKSAGVFEMSDGDRIVDAINKAGGLSQEANTDWVDKVLNLASKLTDGQKIYIPKADEQSDSESANNSDGGYEGLAGGGEGDVLASERQSKALNVNTASQSELEMLWGIGPVTAKNIIEQRPYSDIQELLDKKILKANVFERNKDILTVY